MADVTASPPLNTTVAQRDVIAFLKQPASWEARGEAVETIETHGAYVFMCGREALKIKRAVRLAYFDFSTLEQRRKFILREFDLNADNAPEIYRRVVAITREADGRLAIGGDGEPVEWALSMQRFEQQDLLSHVVDHGGLTPNQVVALADAIFKSHERAEVCHRGVDRTSETAHRVLETLDASSDPAVRAAISRLAPALQQAGQRSQPVRSQRASAGCIRRCHGDLHLGNVVLWKGAPVLFDALEFDEDLAIIDPLYDLAFVLMDLERHGARGCANRVANRYLWRSGGGLDLEGLVAMPLYLALRAAIRAMVALDRARARPDQREALTAHAANTLDFACRMATPVAPRLIVVGGLSGTGKTTLASAIAPFLGMAPGAVHLRTDLERKFLAGAGEFDRLPAKAYTAEASQAVFDRVYERARLALLAGYSVVADGVFALPQERLAIEEVARQIGAKFDGLWLEAGGDLLRKRVGARVNDASDATPAVVDLQLAMETGSLNWRRADSSGPPDAVLEQAVAQLGLTPVNAGAQ